MARAQDRVVDLIAFLLEVFELGEDLGVGEGGVDGVLGLFLFGEVLVLAGGVGVPPGEVGGHVQRPDAGFVVLDEARGLAGDLGTGMCGDGTANDQIADGHDGRKQETQT